MIRIESLAAERVDILQSIQAKGRELTNTEETLAELVDLSHRVLTKTPLDVKLEMMKLTTARANITRSIMTERSSFTETEHRLLRLLDHSHEVLIKLLLENNNTSTE